VKLDSVALWDKNGRADSLSGQAVRRHFCAGKEQYRDSTVSIDPSSYDNKVAQAKLAAASSAASGTGGDGKEL